MSTPSILAIATMVIGILIWRYWPRGKFSDQFRFWWDSEGVPIAFLAAVVILALGGDRWMIPGAVAFAAIWCLIRVWNEEESVKKARRNPPPKPEDWRDGQ